VEDHCQALDLLLHRETPGEAYNTGAGNHRRNIELAEAILAHFLRAVLLLRAYVPSKGTRKRRQILQYQAFLVRLQAALKSRVRCF